MFGGMMDQNQATETEKDKTISILLEEQEQNKNKLSWWDVWYDEFEDYRATVKEGTSKT